MVIRRSVRQGKRSRISKAPSLGQAKYSTGAKSLGRDVDRLCVLTEPSIYRKLTARARVLHRLARQGDGSVQDRSTFIY